MFEHEELAESIDLPQGVTRNTHRLNLKSGPRLDHDDFTARQTIFVQPALDDFSNVRVLHQFEVSLHVKEFLSLRWSLEQALDSIAPSTVAPLDTTLKVGVKFHWSSEG
jgi:hypothetical protein